MKVGKKAKKKWPQRIPANNWRNSRFAAKNRRYLRTEERNAICNLIRAPRCMR